MDAIVILIIVIIVFIAFAVWAANSTNKFNQASWLDENDNPIEVKCWEVLGTHVLGLGIGDKLTLGALTETDLLFTIAPAKKAIARFPLKNLRLLDAQDASQITKRITATRLALLGVFALAARKTKKDEMAYIVIEWTDETGLRHAIFKDTGPGAVDSIDSRVTKLRKCLKEILHTQDSES